MKSDGEQKKVRNRAKTQKYIMGNFQILAIINNAAT